MAKTRTKYVCQQCAHESPGYYGRCPNCGTWGSMVETVEATSTGSTSTARRSVAAPDSASQVTRLADITSDGEQRIPVAIAEFSRVLGGGMVPGSLVLIGGDPGIGKSTLLLQVSTLHSSQQGRVLYVSAEESPRQIKLRAERLRVIPDDLLVLGETDIGQILAHIETTNPSMVVIDSIQTVFVPELQSAAGSVAQVRESTSRLMQFAKRSGIPVMIVGHVTKEGTIAGPRVLEHMVDAVLYLEGDRYHQYRVLRAVKNRFGSTDEVGVFEMTDGGMQEVPNPSQAFLQERSGNASGSAVAVPLEGSRPILIEVQALTTATSYGNPRRTATGFDLNRLQMLIAVLQQRVGYSLGAHDVFINVVGGLRVAEPAVDLGVIAAIGSSHAGRPVDRYTVFIGEVGLSGELRSVSQLDRRLNEVQKLGFRRAIIPAATYRGPSDRFSGIEVVRASTAREAIEAGFTSSGALR
jgi:DNA repair protein RadA/Sms